MLYEVITLPPEAIDVGTLTAVLRRRGGAWEDVLGQDQPVLTAVNNEMATAATPVRDGDEVAFFPPVTGG